MQDLVITNKGQELMAKMIAGTSTATFTKICTSDFDYSNIDLEDLLEMYDIKQTALISKVSRTDTTLVEVLAAINNSNLKNGYYVRGLGLYAEDSDHNEILYAVSIDNENPDYMPAFVGKTVSGISYRLNTKVDNSEQVTLEINPAAIPTIGQLNDLEVSVNSHVKKEIFGEEGIHGIRFYDGALQVKDKNGHYITPTSHGDSSNYGHVKLSDSTNDTSGESSGVAATPLAVKKAYDMAQKALEAAGEAKELTDEMLHSLFGDNVPDPILENNSPEMIQKVARLGIGANFWSVGDKIGIDVTGEVGTLSLNDTYYAFILGFNHNSAIEAGNSIHFQFGKTSDGLDIAFADSNYDNVADEGFIMNTTNIGNVGGWKNSYMRKTICPAFFNALPEEWKNIISHCTKYSDNVGDGSGAEENVTSTLDKIWLLAEYEVRGECEGRGETPYANSSERNFQKQYDYYANGNSLYKGKHDSVYSDCFWWLRSVCANDIVSFCAVTVFSVGAASYLGVLNADKSYGFAPGFVVA